MPFELTNAPVRFQKTNGERSALGVVIVCWHLQRDCKEAGNRAKASQWLRSKNGQYESEDFERYHCPI